MSQQFKNNVGKECKLTDSIISIQHGAYMTEK